MEQFQQRHCQNRSAQCRGGTLSYTRRNPALTGLGFHYEWSETLAAGGWNPFTPVSEIANAGSPVESVTITLDSGLLAKSKLFIRVVAMLE